MGETLREMDRKKRNWTLAAWAFLIFVPWLQLGTISLLIGKNAFATYPVWSDELDYWRSLFSWMNVGLTSGYNGIGEYPPMLGTLSVHGLTPIMLYSGWARLFGLTHYSIVLFNSMWISVAALVFCVLLRPKAWVAALVAALLMVYVPAILYAATSMTELFNYALMLLYIAFFIHSEKTGCRWTRVLAWITVIFACLYRITYFILLLPLIVESPFRFSKKFMWRTALALVLTILAYGVGTAVTAPYPSGFLYNWLREKDAGIFVQMFFSHAKGNLYDYFIRHTRSPMEDTLRQLYTIAMAWTLLCTFVRLERADGRLRLRFAVSRSYLFSFLLLFVPFAAVIMVYETNDWSDFRTLAPFLWGTAVLLFMRGRKALPTVLLAGSAAMLVWLCMLAPIDVFEERDRFLGPTLDQRILDACAAITYNPEADDPYENTIRADIANYHIMALMDPHMGFLFGWFTPENTEESHWILTDHLKIRLMDREKAYTSSRMKVYQKTVIDEP